MTTIYYIRHAQPNYDNHDDMTRELTEKGLRDRMLAAEHLKNIPVEAVLSSPLRRAVDTVAPIAEERGLLVQTDWDFRERKVGDTWLDHFLDYSRRQWEDLDYALPNGESLRQVEQRQLDALDRVLEQYDGKTVVIGSHGTALSVLIHHFRPEFGFEGFRRVVEIMPWMVKFTFDGKKLVDIEEIELE